MIHFIKHYYHDCYANIFFLLECWENGHLRQEQLICYGITHGTGLCLAPRHSRISLPVCSSVRPSEWAYQITNFKIRNEGIAWEVDVNAAPGDSFQFFTLPQLKCGLTAGEISQSGSSRMGNKSWGLVKQWMQCLFQEAPGNFHFRYFCYEITSFPLFYK